MVEATFFKEKGIPPQLEQLDTEAFLTRFTVNYVYKWKRRENKLQFTFHDIRYLNLACAQVRISTLRFNMIKRGALFALLDHNKSKFSLLAIE